MIQVYGIKNCDTVKKARKWLEAQGLEYNFHDFRKDGLEQATLQDWIDQLGWEALLNRRGTTWRNLSHQQKQINDTQQALTLMLQHVSLVKRPVVTKNQLLLVGFKEPEFQRLL